MNNKEVAKVLKDIGTMLDLKGENPFKTSAYYNGARIIETLNKNVSDLVDSGEINNLKGIGKALSEKITELVHTGSLQYYEKLKSSIPEGLMDLLQIQGLGAKKVKIIYEKLNITTIGELEYACKENRLRDLDGFGEKSQQNILQGIELQKKYNQRFLYPVAADDADKIIKYLDKNNLIKKIEIAGSLRRKKETIRDIDIVASCAEKNRQKIMDFFTDYEEKLSVLAKGDTKSTIILNSGIHCDLRLVDDPSFVFLLHHSTGSKEHNTEMRSLAKSKGLKMNEYGLFKGEKIISCDSEAEIFKALDLQYIPPELREANGEIDAAKNQQLPELYTGDPFYGIIHVHTLYSDGTNSIEEIANTCRNMGLQYVGISDHSKSAFYANGLSEDRINQQHKEIDLLNSKLKNFKIFKGIEVDILTDGSLDYNDDVLACFDFVIASIHSQFKMSTEDMTNRIIRALSNPYVTMLGHPTGRLLLGREPYSVDMEKIINKAGELDIIIEINASPYRLDLDWRLGKYANQLNVKTAINPDAHSVDGLKDYIYGINIARKGWFTQKNVLNSYSVNEVEKYFQQKNTDP